MAHRPLESEKGNNKVRHGANDRGHVSRAHTVGRKGFATRGFGGIKLPFRQASRNGGTMKAPMKKSEMKRAVNSDYRRPLLKKKGR
jgi:hypothetical protein